MKATGIAALVLGGVAVVAAFMPLSHVDNHAMFVNIGSLGGLFGLLYLFPWVVVATGIAVLYGKLHGSMSAWLISVGTIGTVLAVLATIVAVELMQTIANNVNSAPRVVRLTNLMDDIPPRETVGEAALSPGAFVLVNIYLAIASLPLLRWVLQKRGGAGR